MKTVIAPGSFKGSLSATEAAETMAEAIWSVDETVQVSVKPMADGGEGTLEALRAAGGKQVSTICTGPLGEQIETNYMVLDPGVAVIESASIAGLVQVPIPQRDPDVTTNFGIGEVITEALDRGITSFVIGLGGSATNDGGFGMLLALGMEAWDEQGRKLGPFGADMVKIAKISLENLDPRLQSVHIKIASDVDNPLCGNHGATAIYGPQKGAAAHQVKVYDEALNHYADLVEKALNKRCRELPGAGAAGGLGFAFLSIGAELVGGAGLVAEAIQVEEAIRHADLVLTGEGQSDEQTLYGKAPGYIGLLAKQHDVPIILMSGSINGDTDQLNERFTAHFSIVNKPLPLEMSMRYSRQLLLGQTQQLFRLIQRFNYLESFQKPTDNA